MHIPLPTIPKTSWLFAAILSSLVMSACGGGSEVLSERTGQAVVDGRMSGDLEGVWRVLGEGTLMEFQPNAVMRYQEVGNLCFPQPSASGAASGAIDQLKDFSYRRTVNLHGIRAELFELPGFPATYTLERLGSVPSECRKAPPTDPATTFQALSDVIALDYAFLKERNIDWAQITSRLAPQAAAAANDDALQAVLSEAIKDFNDVHTALIRSHRGMLHYAFLSGKKPTTKLLRKAFEAQQEISDFLTFQEVWKAGVREQLTPILKDGSGPVLGGTMVWGRLPGNVGYMEIGSMSEFSSPYSAKTDIAMARAEMDRALAALSDTRALIVDVSLNSLGGLDQVSAELAGSFARMRLLGFTKQAHRPQGRSEQSWYVEPKGTEPYIKPVYLLTSDLTVSAAETFTLMMRALPQVIQVGQTTAGSLSNSLVKPLPGNFFISLSNEVYRDSAGVAFEATGIPPRTNLMVFDPSDPAALETGHRRAIDRLLSILGTTSVDAI